MPSKLSATQAIAVEATVSSKGQVTLPKEVRSRLGSHTGNRIRLTPTPNGAFQTEKVLYDLEDMWKMADTLNSRAGKQRTAMTLEEMDEAKVRSVW